MAKAPRIKMKVDVAYFQNALASDPKVLKDLERHTRQIIAPAAAKRLGRLYGEIFNVFHNVTGRGLSDARGSYSGTVSTTHGPVKLGIWAALTRAYRKRKTAGTGNRFWTNTGQTAMWAGKIISLWAGAKVNTTNFDAAPGKLRAGVRNLKVEPRGILKQQVSVTYSMELPAIGNIYVDEVVRSAFASASLDGTYRRTVADRRKADAHNRNLVKQGKRPGASAGGRLQRVRAVDNYEGAPRKGRAVFSTDRGAIVAITDARRPLISALAAALGLKAQQVIKEVR